MMQVPFLDLKTQYLSIKDEIQVALNKVLDQTAFAGGPFVAQFEKEFAEFCQVDHCVGVGSGTDALWLALLALGVGPGDEVITVPDTFIATAEAITYCGATPVFVDVDEKTYNMDPNKLEECIITQKSKLKTQNRLKAIIPVHLFGQTADMGPILEIAKKYGLSVVEDACQAHGALYKGKPAGSMGAAGCFSFYPGKNLGAYGEAGAVTTNNTELASKMRMIRDHGQEKKYYHGCIGWNARMDGFQGAVLSVKLKYLPSWNDGRRKNAALYNSLLNGSDAIITPKEMDYAKHVYHIYAIRTKNRDELIAKLGEKGVNCGIHYPVPVHLQNAYASLGLKAGSFPVAEKCASEFVSLPMFAELTEEQIRYVAGEVKECLGK
jgi:dTDP-4-amino-4,6-dideoxygalactose transaminase